MPRYIRLNGHPTNKDDPTRGVWVSVRCEYWTDDWSKLKLAEISKIPLCPVCGSPGYQSTASKLPPDPPAEERCSSVMTSWLGACK